MPRYGKGRWGFSYKPPVEVTPTPPPPPPPPPDPSGLIVEELANEASVTPANHPDVLWRGNFNNRAECFADFSIHPGVIEREDGVSTDPFGEKYSFVDVPEFGVRGMRWKSRSAETIWPGVTDGATIMNMEKWIRQETLTWYRNNGQGAYNTGSAIGSTVETDLYLRFCVLLESDVWVGFTEQNGLKLSGLERRNQDQPGYVGGPMWHSRVGEPKHFYANTYWFGNQPVPPGGSFNTPSGGGQVLPTINQFELLANTWYTFEQHLKLNSFNGSTPNPDGAIEAWFNDQLMYSAKDFVITNVPSTSGTSTTGPHEIRLVHAQIFHGGPGTMPSSPFHYRVCGFVVARRRIGKPKFL